MNGLDVDFLDLQRFLSPPTPGPWCCPCSRAARWASEGSGRRPSPPPHGAPHATWQPRRSTPPGRLGLKALSPQYTAAAWNPGAFGARRAGRAARGAGGARSPSGGATRAMALSFTAAEACLAGLRARGRSQGSLAPWRSHSHSLQGRARPRVAIGRENLHTTTRPWQTHGSTPAQPGQDSHASGSPGGLRPTPGHMCIPHSSPTNLAIWWPLGSRFQVTAPSFSLLRSHEEREIGPRLTTAAFQAGRHRPVAQAHVRPHIGLGGL